jgi:hypothetical protein
VKNDRNTINTKQKAGMYFDDVEGFALWYLNSQPTLGDLSTSFGFKASYNGLAIYVFKHDRQWRILGIYNQGLDGLSIEAAVSNLSK